MSEEKVYADRFEADHEIPGQKIVCMSFVSDPKMLGFKIRGSFDSEKEAMSFCKKVHEREREFNISFGSVGRMMPFDPDTDRIRKKEYHNEQLGEFARGREDAEVTKERDFKLDALEQGEFVGVTENTRKKEVQAYDTIRELEDIPRCKELVEKALEQQAEDLRETQKLWDSFTPEEIEKAEKDYEERNKKYEVEKVDVECSEDDILEYLKIDPQVEGQNYACVTMAGPTLPLKSNAYEIKIRGSFETQEEAKERCAYFFSKDKCPVYMCEVGKWIAIPIVETKNPMLELCRLVKSHIESEKRVLADDQKYKDQMFRMLQYDSTVDGQAALASQKENPISVRNRLDGIPLEVERIESELDFLLQKEKDLEARIQEYTEEELQEGRAQYEEEKERERLEKEEEDKRSELMKQYETVRNEDDLAIKYRTATKTPIEERVKGYRE